MTPLTQRDASARTFDDVFTRETPRDPDTWTAVEAQPVPDWAVDYNLVDKALSGLGKAIGPGIIEHAKATRREEPTTRTRRPQRPTHPTADHPGRHETSPGTTSPSSLRKAKSTKQETPASAGAFGEWAVLGSNQ